MKTEFLVLCLLLLAINCANSNDLIKCSSVTSPSKKDCNNLNADLNPDYFCCFVEYKYKNKPSTGDQEGKYCSPIAKAQYDDIKNFVKTAKETSKSLGYEMSKYKINCQSAFLKIGLASLVTYLLF